VQIVIEDNRIIRLAQLFDVQANAIVRKFRVKDPKAHHKRAMRSGHWDGYYKFYNSRDQIMPRGYLKDLVDLCEENDFPYEIVDLRDKPKYPVPAPKSFDNKLVDAEIGGNVIKAHKHQMRCWNSVCLASKHPVFEVGTHFHPTGAGKSLMMAGIVKLLRCPTVIITEQTVVLNQLVEALKLFNVVHHDDIGEFYSGKMPEGNIVCVGSIAALQTPKKPILGKFNIKIETIKKDFSNLESRDIEKLKGIVGEKGYFAWKRSDVVDYVKKKHSSKEKLLVADLVPSDGKWNDSFDGYVYDTIKEMIIKDQDKLSSIIGNDNIEIWKKTDFIDNDYDRQLVMALKRFDEYDRKRYFDIAMKSYKTLVKKTAVLQEMVGKCELLLVDEMDNAASSNYGPLFHKWFSGRYIHGFSGTPYDPDKPVENMKLVGCFGPVISKSTRRELEDIGQIQPVKYTMIQFGDMDQKDKTAFDVAEREIIIDNPEFHDKIAKSVANWPDQRHLIIVDTTNIEDIGKSLEELIPNSAFIYGKTSMKKRKEIISNFEKDILKVMIVSKIGKRGMDLGGGAHNLHIIGGGKLRSNFDQIIGRAVRKCEQGYSRVFDYYYTGNYYLLDHSRKRLRHIVDMGYVANVAFGSVLIKAEDFVKSRYKIPKEFFKTKI